MTEEEKDGVPIFAPGSTVRPAGVSVVICCHNSAERLPQTLAFLGAQRIQNALWEVIVVNNGSTDETVDVARQAWPDRLAHLFRVVDEPQLGQTHARLRGLEESRYEYVCFVDDDNWLCETWIEDVLDVMSRHPDTALCGGVNSAVSDQPLPWWFEVCKAMYAISSEEAPTGDITALGHTICGAGLTLRQSAWRELRAQGFTPILSGRRGTSLAANEDNELCHALRLAGWRLRIDPRLHLQHFLPARRLNWNYARRLYLTAGLSGVVLDAYHYGAKPQPGDAWGRLRETWPYQVASLLKHFPSLPLLLIRCAVFRNEGMKEELLIQTEVGRFLGLFMLRSSYSRYIQQVRTASWRREMSECR